MHGYKLDFIPKQDMVCFMKNLKMAMWPFGERNRIPHIHSKAIYFAVACFKRHEQDGNNLKIRIVYIFFSSMHSLLVS